MTDRMTTAVRHFAVQPDGSGVLTIETFEPGPYEGFPPSSQGTQAIVLSAADIAAIRDVLAPPVPPALPVPPVSPAVPVAPAPPEAAAPTPAAAPSVEAAPVASVPPAEATPF